MRRVIALVSVVTVVGIVVSVVACGATANDVAACRQIESARCVQAGAMNCLDLSYPIHEGNSTADNVTACQLFYNDACLHGFVTTAALSTNKVNGCLKAINTATSCEVILEPQTSPECAWLIPPDAGVDAGVDASDAGIDQYVVVTVLPDSGVDTGLAACYEACDSTCAGDTGCITECESECQNP
jgi:hypothetical protein